MARKTLSWSPVKTVVKKILSQYHPEAVKAEIIWDHVKTEIPDTRITRETVYGILYHMNKEGEIERVSTGWYQLPGKEKRFTPDPVWQMGYDEGYKEGYEEGYKDALSPTIDLEKMKEKMVQILFDKLVLEARKVRPDPRRLLLIKEILVEMMRKMTGGHRGANS